MCGRTGCSNFDMPVRVNGLLTDPPGWSCVTVTGRPITNTTLCPPCTAAVRGLLASSPSEVERLADVAREETFARGYAEGLDDARARNTAGEVPA